MQHRLDVVENPALDRVFQPVRFEVVVERERRQVAPFLGASETIHDEDAIVALAVERPYERAADEPGAARDEREALVDGGHANGQF